MVTLDFYRIYRNYLYSKGKLTREINNFMKIIKRKTVENRNDCVVSLL